MVWFLSKDEDEHQSFENRCKIIQPDRTNKMNEMQCKLPEQAQKLEQVESRAVKEADSSIEKNE